ncbi:phage gp6-like head-tail connector protein [Flavobacterium sp. UGB4466]|uniref:phage gp6-like head-tail connector protein n=1 Tax=Flavobacterium sp. UGB4466 TaxID=2730889 RepID=UPI00192AB04D|nr:phage gp6-like head-tail connector protein [Flavobacterium sp. UGB4466]
METNSYYQPIATTSIITLAKAKKQIKADEGVGYEDDLVLSYIDAAQGSVSNFINRSIAERSLIIEYDKFESKITFERNYDNDSITKVEYYAPGETTLTELPADQYKLQKSTILDCYDIKFLSTPQTDVRTDAVIVTIKQGFTAATCPAPLIQAMMLRLSDFNERREDREQGNNPASNNLARAYRKY